MPVIELTEPTDSQKQLDIYNQNIGGNLNRSTTYTLPADKSFAVVACILVDDTTTATLTDTIIPAVTALAEVDSVEGDQLYGKTPSTIHDAGYECILNVSSTLTLLLGTENDNFTQNQRNHETMKLAKNKTWAVLLLYVPLPMTGPRITALQAALETVPGITRAEHLIDGTVPNRAYGDGTLQVATHVRLEPITP